MKRTLIFLLCLSLIAQVEVSNGQRIGMRSISPRISVRSIGPRISGTKIGTTNRISTRSSTKIGGGSRGIRSFSKTSTPRSVSKYLGKSFAKPRTIQTSRLARHQVSFKYTRPVRFYNPYLAYFLLMSTYVGAAADTNAFPGFGMGKSGGAGASYHFTDSLKNEHGKDTLEVTELAPINFLSDYAAIVLDKDEPNINSIIRRYKKTTGVEIAILTIPTLGEEIDLEEYAQVLFDTWGVGERGANNGILIIISTEDEMLRVQPGYGVEELLPDATCREIEDKIMIPNCKEKKWEEAIIGGVHDIIKRLGNKPIEMMKRELAERKEKERQELMNKIYTTLVIAVIVLIGFVFFLFKRKRYYNECD